MVTRRLEYLPRGSKYRELLGILESPLVLAPPVVGGPEVLEVLVGDLLERGLDRGRQLPLALELLVLHGLADAAAERAAQAAAQVVAALAGLLLADGLHFLPEAEQG